MIEKRYVFYASDAPQVFLKPWHEQWKQVMGDKLIFNVEDIKRLCILLPQSKSRRLASLMIGSKLKLFKRSKNTDLMIRVLTSKEYNVIKNYKEIQEKYEVIQERMKFKCLQEFKEISQLDSELRMLHKESEKVNVKLMKDLCK